MHDVAVLHDIILALDSEFAGGAAGKLGLERDEVIVLYDLGADETLLEVGVDDSGGLRGLVALVDGLGADLIGAGGEECMEVEQRVGGLDEPHHARLLKSELFKEHLPFLVGLKLGDVGLNLR